MIAPFRVIGSMLKKSPSRAKQDEESSQPPIQHTSYVFPITEDTRRDLLDSVRGSKVIFTAMYFAPDLHPLRLASASHSGYCLCHSLYYIAYKISQNQFCVKEYFVSFWFYYIYNVIRGTKKRKNNIYTMSNFC